MPNTIQEKYAGSTFAGATREVLAKDASRLITMYDDFVFDAMNADGYSGGALPAVNAAIPVAGLVNLAPDVAPALGRAASAVTAVPTNTGQLPTFTGKGIKFLAGTSAPLKIRKGGVLDYRVMEPTLEGFMSHLVIVYQKVLVEVNNASAFYAGQAGGTSQWSGYQMSGGGTPYNVQALPAGLVLEATQTAVWRGFATAWAYNSGAGTSTVRRWTAGTFLAESSQAHSFSGTANVNALAQIGGMLGGSTLNGEVARVRRILNPGNVLTSADYDAIVAADFAWKMPILLAP